MLKAQAKSELDRALALDIVRVTEASAVAAALWRGRGNAVSYTHLTLPTILLV